MIDLDELKVLLRAFRDSSFDELNITAGNLSLNLRQKPDRAKKSGPADADDAAPHKVLRVIPVTSPTAGVPEEDIANCILSGRVGHFFPLRNQRGDLAFKSGDPIEDGQTFGLIESMNLKYEVRADRSGTFDKYLIDEGEPVEYGQALVRLQ